MEQQTPLLLSKQKHRTVESKHSGCLHVTKNAMESNASEQTNQELLFLAHWEITQFPDKFLSLHKPNYSTFAIYTGVTWLDTASDLESYDRSFVI